MNEPGLNVDEVADGFVERPPKHIFEPIIRLVLYLLTIGIGLALAGLVTAPFIFVFGASVTDIFDFQKSLPVLLFMTLYYLVATLIVLPISFGFVLFIDKQPAEALGFNLRGKWTRELLFGVCVGATATGFIFAVSYIAGWVKVTGTIFNKPPAEILPTLFLTVLLMIAIAVVEEVMMRGYVLRTIKWGYGTLPALIGSSVFFSMFHFLNPGVEISGFLGTMAAGLVLGYGYWQQVGCGYL